MMEGGSSFRYTRGLEMEPLELEMDDAPSSDEESQDNDIVPLVTASNTAAFGGKHNQHQNSKRLLNESRHGRRQLQPGNTITSSFRCSRSCLSAFASLFVIASFCSSKAPILGVGSLNGDANTSGYLEVVENPDKVSAIAPALSGMQCGQEFTDAGTWKEEQGHLPKNQRCRTKTNSVQNECCCKNPLLPAPRDLEEWRKAVERNQQLGKDESQALGSPLDVVLFGDSQVEHWLGTRKAIPDPALQDQHQVYQRLFRSDSPLFVHGLALGIGGDRTPNLLYRLLNAKELPSTISPKVLWLMVGTNDLFLDECTVDTTLAGILQVVETISELQPNAKLVLHSILPRSDDTNAPLSLNTNPYWNATLELNQRLDCLAGSLPQQLSFFNATEIFLNNDGSNKVNASLFLPDALHPNGLGSIRWGIEILRKTLELLERQPPEPDIIESFLVKQNGTNDNDIQTTLSPLDSEVADICTSISAPQNWTSWRVAVSQQEPCRTSASCSCEQTTVSSEGSFPFWQETFNRNKELVNSLATDDRPLDLVIIGDSIVEHFLGTGHGKSDWGENNQVYNQLFRSEKSYVRGIPLGIAGDQIPQVLYRLENGELPASLDPPLFWILVGTNNLAAGGCTVNATLAGILQVVAIICEKSPNAKVVIHSILPRGEESLVDGSNKQWELASELNKLLACFALYESRVFFFNGTAFFLTVDQTRINATLMPDFVHPSGHASIRWGEAIVRKSLSLLGRYQPGANAFDIVSISVPNATTSMGKS